MSALRAARGYTGRDKILKFEGCYHGHGDSLLVKAGSGAATFGKPDSAGVTKGTAKDTLVTPYNDIPAFKAIMDAEGDEIAAVIVEPVAGNMGCVLPVPGFLEALREETAKQGTVLIFDEVSVRLPHFITWSAELLSYPSGYDLSRKDHWRRPSSCCLWRQEGNHGLHCP